MHRRGIFGCPAHVRNPKKRVTHLFVTRFFCDTQVGPPEAYQGKPAANRQSSTTSASTTSGPGPAAELLPGRSSTRSGRGMSMVTLISPLCSCWMRGL